jgi:GNAT superfamily N-acetyltransferase
VTAPITHTCEECEGVVEGADLRAFGDAYIAHAREKHPEWPFPDVAIRNYAEATQRATGPKERLETIGEVEIHPVGEERIEDFLTFFDRDAFPDNFAWAACYCTEPHLLDPKAPTDGEGEGRTWQSNRAHMAERLRSGGSFGYLAYVDGKVGGWVNASKRSDYALFREGPGGLLAGVADEDVVGISCFVIAPPYRRHGLARRLLDRVVADAAGRGVAWVEAYPFNEGVHGWGPDFRGARTMYDAAGFEPVEVRERYSVVRRRA